MQKKGKQKEVKKGSYLQKDSSFNIRNLVMRTPTSSSPNRSPEVYEEAKKPQFSREETVSKPSRTEVLRGGNEKLENIIKELNSFDVNSIQRRSDPRMRVLTGRINEIIAEIFGHDSEEYDDHVIWSLDTLPITIGGSWYPLPEVREGYKKGIQTAASKLEALLAAQRKKLEAIATEKPKKPVTQEASPQPIITGKEKVSLVNLRGKIRSRESVFFTRTQPVSGNGESQQSAVSNSALRTDTKKEAVPGNKDQDSIRETNTDCKNVVLLESLEEKLRKLEKETPVFGEDYLPSDEIGQDPLREESGREDIPLSVLMAELNKIVTVEPEYAEAFAGKVPGNKEEALVRNKIEHCADPEIEDGTSAFPGRTIGFASPGLDGEEEEVFIIDGDNPLTSDLNFLEALECQGGDGELTEPRLDHGSATDDVFERKGISLEALEQKLREFEGKNTAERELPLDVEELSGQPVLFLENTDALPPDMMSELTQTPASGEMCTEQAGSGAILVIDGDESLSNEPVALELATGDVQEEEVFVIDGDTELAGDLGEKTGEDSFNLHDDRAWDAVFRSVEARGSVDHDEVVILECDANLPDDVSDQLSSQEDPSDCLKAQQTVREEDTPVLEKRDISSGHPDAGEASIIDLISGASCFSSGFSGADEQTQRAVLVDDLEKRLTRFESRLPLAEYLNPATFYAFEKMEVSVDEGEAVNQSGGKDRVDLARNNLGEERPVVAFFGHDLLAGAPANKRTIDPIVHITVTHETASPRLTGACGAGENADSLPDAAELEEGFFQEPYPLDYAGDDITLDLSEDTIYGEARALAGLKNNLVPWGEDLPWSQEAAGTSAEVASFEGLFEDAVQQSMTDDSICNELPYELFAKDIQLSSDYTCVTAGESAVDMFDFEPTLVETIDDTGSIRDAVTSGLPETGMLSDGDHENRLGVNVFGGMIPGETVIVADEDETTDGVIRTLGEESETIDTGLPEPPHEVGEHSLLEEVLTLVRGQVDFVGEAVGDLPGDMVLIKTDESQGPDFAQPVDGTETEIMPNAVADQSGCLNVLDVLDLDVSLDENSEETAASYHMDELALSETREFAFLEDDRASDQLPGEELLENEAFTLMEDSESLESSDASASKEELLSVEAFEKALKNCESDAIQDDGAGGGSRDAILLEAFEEMLNNLEMGMPAKGHVQPEITVTESIPPEKDETVPRVEEVVVSDIAKEPVKKAVLIKSNEERINPFAVTDVGKERLQAKTLRADDLELQIGELRYRIDDLKTFDVESVDQRFDPRVRALGDTVNNTLADIFGRNTPAYWQHALPSLDSLPVVVGGPKLSPEELQDAYRRKIADAISKVTIAIGILEAKLGSLTKRETVKKTPEITVTESIPPEKDETVPRVEEVVVSDIAKEPVKKAVLIKSNEERINPFAVTDVGKERLQAKTLRADDLELQIGELRYRIDDLKTFDVESVDQRFDPRVRALGDTVNNTLADIFGRNTPAYWQHALPSLDSLPVVVGGPKLSPEELQDAYRRKIADAISKVTIAIGILEAKLGSVQGKGAAGQVLYFTPKTPRYSDIQSLR